MSKQTVLSLTCGLLLLAARAVGAADAPCSAVFAKSPQKVSDLVTAIQCLERTSLDTLPKGIILAWYAQSGTVPAGWAICDGSNGTPNLRERFLRGVASFADVKADGGGSERLKFTVVADPRNVSDWRWGDTPWKDTPRNAAKANQDFNLDNRPPFADVIYIMKIK